jgi:hypothetical protein
MVERKDDISQDRPFLSRWSQLKQRAEIDADAGRPDTDPEQAEGADAEAADEELAANQAAAEAIDIDGLNEDSDYSPFFKDGVPEDLKNVALRRLWRSNPVFANIDGLNDYDEDFTIPKTPIGAIKTAWKLGRGFLTDDDLADKDGTGPDAPTAEPGEGDEAVAEAVASDPDPVRLDPVRPDSVSPDPALDAQRLDPEPKDSQPDDAVDKASEPDPTPGVGLRSRLDMAAFSGRDDD